jgi:UDP-N-acetylmuramyl tripeptide synthase
MQSRPVSAPHAVPAAALPARTRAAVALGAAVSGLSRRAGRGDGTVIGGRAMLAVDPGALAHLAAGHVSCLVSGTNGKTTTTSLLRAALATLGPVATNLLGANLPTGIATALAAGPVGANAALEVDEAWLGRVVTATEPAVVLLLNLSRDQLDRNNEVRTLASGWRRIFADRPATTVVANADDPLVVWGAGSAARVRWVAAGQPWTADASGCPNCGGRIVFEAVDHPGTATLADAPTEPAVGGEGGWACSACDLRRPHLDVWIDGDDVVTREGRRTRVRLALPGRANRANATMAMTAAVCLGADPDAVADAMATTDEVVGRYRTVEVDGVRARMLLAKNPAGWLEVLDMLRPAPMPVVVAINARIADGRDPSWLWDVPFQRLAGRLVIATGERGRDLAVRLHYAEVEHRFVDDPVAAVGAAVARAQAQSIDEIDVVANYTSFQTLRVRFP